MRSASSHRKTAKKQLRRLRREYTDTGQPSTLAQIRALYRFVSGPPKRRDRDGAGVEGLGASTRGAT